ncbi:MAG: hypothetical protein IGR92_05150 [Leptolyngbyaceae cyanobacterium T60_A2020_046]|nr:hypothetical protein [Leptolyngbyaceae cyanobacterium T60_A2020_046]
MGAIAQFAIAAVCPNRTRVTLAILAPGSAPVRLSALGQWTLGHLVRC